jgi:hypothetical protein
VTESQTGPFSSAAFIICDGPNGTGRFMSNPFAASDLAGYGSYAAPYFAGGGGGVCILSTSRTLYLYQIADAVNPGAISVYVKILPLD